MNHINNNDDEIIQLDKLLETDSDQQQLDLQAVSAECRSDLEFIDKIRICKTLVEKKETDFQLQQNIVDSLRQKAIPRPSKSKNRITEFFAAFKFQLAAVCGVLLLVIWHSGLFFPLFDSGSSAPRPIVSRTDGYYLIGEAGKSDFFSYYEPVTLLDEQNARIEMSDGSILHLQGPLRLSLGYRNFHLVSGSIKAEVVAADKPLKATTVRSEITVVGTIFSVISDSEHCTISVEQGEILVTSNQKSDTSLSAGESLTLKSSIDDQYRLEQIPDPDSE